MTDDSETPEDNKGLGAISAFASVFAAAFGVQSSKNRERDFKQGKFGTFVAAGLVFTALFVGTVYLVVTTVLENAR